MARFPRQYTAVFLQPGPYFAPAVAAFCVLLGCVNLTPPWDKPDARIVSGGAGTAGATATTGGNGGTSALGGTTDTGSGGDSASGGGGTDSIDAPGGGGGATDPGQSSGGSTGQDAAVDAPSSGSGGSGGRKDAGSDAPQSSVVGGKADAGPDARDAAGGTAGTGGTVVGGTLTTGGAGNTGGSATGGTTSTGGTGGTSSTVPDAGPDANPLLEGLLVYYRFESASGTTVEDSSGNGYDGTLSSGPPPDGGAAPSGDATTFVTGKVGNALALHKAAYGYVRVPPAVFLDRTELTIAFWVKVTTEQNWQRILDVGVTPNPYQHGNTSTGTKYFNIVPKSTGGSAGMLFSITTNGYSNEQSLNPPSLVANTWTHITVVLPADGGGKLYIDGIEKVTSTTLVLRPKDLGTIDYAFIGKSRFDADPPFDGLVDCFRVYSRALSAAEVTALFNYTAGS